MITIKKIKTLKSKTRLRKYVFVLHELENLLKNSKAIDKVYYKSLCNEIYNEEELPNRVKELSIKECDLYSINSLRHSLMSHLQMEPSEWDFTAPLDKTSSNSTKLGMNIYLDDIRSPFNLGSIFRTAECFGVSNIYISEETTSPNHTRAIRTSMGCIDLINWAEKKIEDINQPIFALELGGIPIDEFEFPKEATVIIGSEELGVSPQALKLADKSLGRVTIPLLGEKSSLNVANATAILLSRWSEYILKG